MDESTLIKVMLNLQILLTDKSIPVQKRVIQGAITIYKRMLSWLCKAPNVNKEMEDAWIQLNAIKTEITGMIDSDNDGIRTSCVKFLECVVLLQSYPDGNTNKVSSDFSLEDVPLTLKVARRRKLEEEAKYVLHKLHARIFKIPHNFIFTHNLSFVTCKDVYDFCDMKINSKSMLFHGANRVS